MSKKPNRIKTEKFKRAAVISFNQETQTGDKIENVAISSENTVRQWFGTEKLVHNEKSINLERAADGLSLLFNHDRSSLVGRVDNIHLADDKVLRGDITFAGNTFAEQVKNDVLGGFIRDISVSGTRDNYKDVKGGIEVTRWTPMEVSLVTVPADPTVGINRSHEGEKMGEEERKPGGDGRTLNQQLEADRMVGVNAGVERELKRANDIRSIFSRHAANDNAMELMERCLTDSTVSPELASRSLLDLLADGQAVTPIAKPTQRAQEMQVGEGDIDKFSRGINNALNVAAGNIDDEKIVKEVNSSNLRTYSLMDIVREFGRRGNIIHGGMSRGQMIDTVMSRSVGGHSTSDFPGIMLDVANKTMARAFTEADSSWQKWAQKGSGSDFRPTHIISMSEFSNLEHKPEGGEYKYGTMADKVESIAIQTMAKGFSLTREAIINDNMGALTEAPAEMGKSAARGLDDLAYATLTGNPVLNEDGKAVFHADHNNIGSAGAPTNESISELRQLMRMQRGILAGKNLPKNKKGGSFLNIRPVYIICPISLEDTIRTILMADYASDDLSQPNLLKGVLEVIADPRMDDTSEFAYYVLGDTNTVRMMFLDGRQAPYLASKDGWNVDGMDYHVRIDVGAGWTDFRAATFNAGA